MIHVGVTLRLHNVRLRKFYFIYNWQLDLNQLQVLAVLLSCIRELEVNKDKFKNPGPKDDLEQVMEEYELNIITALYLCTIITKLLKRESPKTQKSDKNSSYKLVYTLNKMNLKLRDGQTLLHLAVNGVTPVDDFHTSDVCRLVNLNFIFCQICFNFHLFQQFSMCRYGEVTVNVWRFSSQDGLQQKFPFAYINWHSK